MAGPFRGIVGKGGVDAATDVPVKAIATAFPLHGSWYFVTQDGAVFSAQTFLGALADTGLLVGEGVKDAAIGPDRVLLSDRRHALWSFNGRAATRLTPPAPGVVTSLSEGPNGRPLVGICDALFTVSPDDHFKRASPAPSAKPSLAAAVDQAEIARMIGVTEQLEAVLEPRIAASSAALLRLRTMVVLRDGSFEPAESSRVRLARVCLGGPSGSESCSLRAYAARRACARADRSQLDRSRFGLGPNCHRARSAKSVLAARSSFECNASAREVVSG